MAAVLALSRLYLRVAVSYTHLDVYKRQIVNMGMARMAGAPVLIVGDIDKGGVFAALAGTMLLLTDEEKAMVKGTIINKFRGDVSILKRGLTMLEDIIHVPVVGVVPYLRIHVDDEDSLTERFERSQKPALVDIAVLRFPRISNFTDFNPLEYIEGVSLRYVGSVAAVSYTHLDVYKRLGFKTAHCGRIGQRDSLRCSCFAFGQAADGPVETHRLCQRTETNPTGGAVSRDGNPARERQCADKTG